MRIRFRRGHHEDRPTRPVYADQRKFGITLGLRTKLLVLVIAALLTAGLLELLWIQNYITNAHAARLRDDKQLACLLVEDTPPGNQLADEIREKYGCPAFSNRRPPAPSTSRSASQPPPRVTVPPHPATSATRTPGTLPPPATRTRTVTMPGTPRTRTVTAPRTSSGPRRPPPPTGSSSLTLCVVLPIVCALPVP